MTFLHRSFTMNTFSLSAQHLLKLLESIRPEAFDALEMLDDVDSLIAGAHEAGKLTEDEARKLTDRCKQRRAALTG